MSIRFALTALLLVVIPGFLGGQDRPTTSSQIAAALKRLSPHVAAEPEREPLRTGLGRHLREQIDTANRASSAAWHEIRTRDDWELFRREKLTALRKSLGEMPQRPAVPRTVITGRIQGDGFQIQNLVFESRPGLVVTANLYVPDPRPKSIPGIVLSHSHHNPKEQGELQDMGMTWARAGCFVLVPDHLGHGERRQHPFVSAADYPAPFQVGRQDYYFRYDTSLQLYLAGETLMGWMVHDLMTGIDVLLNQPGIDARRIAILGSVAGGGDPAAVTAALDERIACACPFNFGGPQPESPYPLPDGVEATFNYAGSGSWESTRDLYRSAADGFLPWAIVGSIAPRSLIHAHEFAWDGQRDPVWKRYQKIWDLYGAVDRLSVAHGNGTLTGQDPPGSHCNNIGAVHRRQIHDAFRRWLNIDVRAEDEYSHRRLPGELVCLTDDARRRLGPRQLHEILSRLTNERLATAGKESASSAPDDRRKKVRNQWSRLLGEVATPKQPAVHEGAPPIERQAGLIIRREILETEPGVLVPLMTVALEVEESKSSARRPMTIAVADDGIAGILRRRAEVLSEALHAGSLVALVDVRGTGASQAGADRGPQSRITAYSASALMLGQPLVAGQLRDLQAVWRHLRSREDIAPHDLTIIGDSGSAALATGTAFLHPHRVESRPPEAQVSGALLALLFALFEDDVTSVEAAGGLVSFQSVLDSPFVQVPHCSCIPGVLQQGDLADVVAALAPRRVRLSRLVDGRNRLVNLSSVQAAYAAAVRAYSDAGQRDRLEFAEISADE